MQPLAFRARQKPGYKMHDDRAEIIRDERGRECLRFVTRSGVTAIVATSISMGALDKLIRKLERKLARTQGFVCHKGIVVAYR